MPGGKAVLFDCFDVLPGRVAHIAVPAVVGELFRELDHLVVAVGFCEHGCGGNAGVGGVSVHYGREWVAVEGPETVPVDKKELGLDAELSYCALHSGHACPEYVQGVDFFRGNFFDRPGNRFFFNHFA